MSNQINLVDFKNRKLDSRLNDLMTAMFKHSPNLEFNYINSSYSDGGRTSVDDVRYFERLEVFDVEDLKSPIGIIGLDGGQYFVVSPNIKDGRNWWGSMRGQVKKSKHMKNILKVANNAIKPLNFDQAMSESFDRFRSQVQSVLWDKRSTISHATGNCLNIVQEDMLHLFSQGYIPKSPAFKNIMEYIVKNQDFIKKYNEYNPKSVGVWVKANGVQYQIEKEIKTVNTKADLPENILSKICIMDICDKGSFDENLGYKHSDNHYWVICD